jgi:oligo-1,6-glucosidase
MLGGLNFMLRGIPFIYQGQEIGMENAVFTSIDDVDDCGTLRSINGALTGE